MTEDYIELTLKGWHLDSRPRYVAPDGSGVNFDTNQTVRMRWPNGDITEERVFERLVKYETVMGDKIITPVERLATIRVDHNGSKLTLESLNGLEVHKDDVHISPPK